MDDDSAILLVDDDVETLDASFPSGMKIDLGRLAEYANDADRPSQDSAVEKVESREALLRAARGKKCQESKRILQPICCSIGTRRCPRSSRGTSVIRLRTCILYG